MTGRRHRLMAVALVLALHGGGLLLLLQERQQLAPRPAPTRVSLWQTPRPVERSPSREPRKAALPAAPVARLPPGAAIAIPVPVQAPVQAQGESLVAEIPALEATVQSRPGSATLDLRARPAGPVARRTGLQADLRELLRSDPRANSPRLGLQERMAVAIGGVCFVDDRDADGIVRRYEGRWVAREATGQSFTTGAALLNGVGGKAPAVMVRTCERLP